MKIYLVTHAHTEQLPGMAVDTWQLSARGIEQAAILGTHKFWDEIDRVVVSSEPKTWLTVAAIVQQRDIPVTIDSRLDELRRVGWIEDYAAHVAQVLAAPNRAVGGWETVSSVQMRALAALHDMQQRFAGETLAVVGHGLCLSIMVAAILGQAQVEFEAWQRLAFASYAVISTAPLRLHQDFARTPYAAR